jgi:hypothetical protein
MVGNVDVATPTELLPLIPPQAGEKGIDDSCRFFLDSLMEFMITQVTFFSRCNFKPNSGLSENYFYR